MQNDELPLTEVVDSDRFARAFEKHGVDFGDKEGVVYTPAITLWALVSQTFFAGAQRSCKAAVLQRGRVASRIVVGDSGLHDSGPHGLRHQHRSLLSRSEEDSFRTRA